MLKLSTSIFQKKSLERIKRQPKKCGFPGGTVVKNPPANAGDTGPSPGPEDPTCHGATKPVCHNY